MKIGELAKITKCTVETIRYYEKEGLLPAPARTSGNYRHYTEKHVDRLRFIRNCRALDMNHDEIRALLAFMDQPDQGCGAVNTLLDEHILHVNTRIGELQHLSAQLQELRNQCQHEQPLEDCGILQELTEMETEPTAPYHTHSHLPKDPS